MAKMKTITCACGCGLTREVRVADIKRGWGKYFDKSHKAVHQTRRTGRGRPRQMSDDEYYYATTHPFDPESFANRNV